MISRITVCINSEPTYFVNHHDSEEITNCSKEEPVEVMLHSTTDVIAEDVENYLAHHEEEDPERDVSKRPSVL